MTDIKVMPKTLNIMKSSESYDLTLQRWAELFQKDPTLQPDNLMLIVADWYLKVPEGRIPLSTARALIVDSAIRWLNGKHEGLTIGDGSWDPDYDGVWPNGYSVQVISPVIAENVQSGDALIDALYEAVVLVMAREEEMAREHAKRNTRWARFKRKFGSIFKRDPANDIWDR